MPKCSKCYKDYRVFLNEDIGLCPGCFWDDLFDDGDAVRIYPVGRRAGRAPKKY